MRYQLVVINLPDCEQTGPEYPFDTMDALTIWVKDLYPNWTSLVVTVLP